MTVLWLWAAFLALVLMMLALDLGVFHREDHVVDTKEALTWTGIWIAVSLAFNVGVYFMYEANFLEVRGALGAAQSGTQAALQFLTGYVIEKSLSLDNIFVIALIFGFFRVPRELQHRVLFWGIIGALVMRGAMIAAGVALITRFTWTVYIFGGFLLVTAVKMMVDKDEGADLDKNFMVRLAKRLFPVTKEFHGNRFFIVREGQRYATPLFLALVVVEGSDVIFAVDSIPAIFAVTTDPFLVFTSNIFAILGLRSLYFALASLLEQFRYLKESLVFVLAYVGVKMILTHHFHIPPAFSLAIILGILAVGVVASLWAARRRGARAEVEQAPVSGGGEP